MYGPEEARILEEAADVLLIDGWARAAGAADRGEPSCILNAVAKARHPEQPRANGWNNGWDVYGLFPESVALAVHLGLDHDATSDIAWMRSGARNIAFWNDDLARTEDDVHDALKGAAKAIRNGEL
jgi:hypothetical protein